MGAVTAIFNQALFRRKDHLITGLVLDSPFASLKKLALEKITDKTGLPDFLVTPILSFLDSELEERAGFEIDDITPIDHIRKIKIPCIFISGVRDTLVPPHHVKLLHKHYTGKKKLMMINAGHNDPRPKKVVEDVLTWL